MSAQHLLPPTQAPCDNKMRRQPLHEVGMSMLLLVLRCITVHRSDMSCKVSSVTTMTAEVVVLGVNDASQ